MSNQLLIILKELRIINTNKMCLTVFLKDAGEVTCHNKYCPTCIFGAVRDFSNLDYSFHLVHIGELIYEPKSHGHS